MDIIPKPLSPEARAQERKYLRGIFAIYAGGLALIGGVLALPLVHDHNKEGREAPVQSASPAPLQSPAPAPNS